MTKTENEGGSHGLDCIDRPYIVVLTGGIAAGKTSVSNIFKQLGTPVIDTDEIARQIVQPGEPLLQKVIATFGKQFLAPNGALDRAALRKQVFSNPQDRIKLEKLLHPAIRNSVNKQIEKIEKPYCILVIPLYAKSPDYFQADCVLVVDVSTSKQTERVMARDHVDRTHAEAVIATQSSREDRNALADYVIANDKDFETLRIKVAELHEVFLKNAAKRERE